MSSRLMDEMVMGEAAAGVEETVEEMLKAALLDYMRLVMAKALEPVALEGDLPAGYVVEAPGPEGPARCGVCMAAVPLDECWKVSLRRSWTVMVCVWCWREAGDHAESFGPVTKRAFVARKHAWVRRHVEWRRGEG